MSPVPHHPFVWTYCFSQKEMFFHVHFHRTLYQNHHHHRHDLELVHPVVRLISSLDWSLCFAVQLLKDLLWLFAGALAACLCESNGSFNILLQTMWIELNKLRTEFMLTMHAHSNQINLLHGSPRQWKLHSASLLNLLFGLPSQPPQMKVEHSRTEWSKLHLYRKFLHGPDSAVGPMHLSRWI